MKSSSPSAAHQAFRDDMLTVLRRHGGSLSAQEMLAVAAYTVGQLIALQDQRTMTAKMAMDVVTANIEAGNIDAIEDSLGNPTGAA